MSKNNEQTKAAVAVSSTDLLGWIIMTDQKPSLNRIVILEDPDMGTMFGCRYDDPEGWLWAIATETPYITNEGEWDAECCIEKGADFNPVMWHDLPFLPNVQA
jgi:hypothetical protein